MDSFRSTGADDAVVLTDFYGREIAPEAFRQSFLQSAPDDDAADAGEIEMVRREESPPETTKSKKARQSELRRKDSHEKDGQEILGYADTLHKGLKIMWVPMVFCGRLPFRLLLKNNRATIVVNKRSPAYIACLTTCILTWLVFVWITYGILLLIGPTAGAMKKDFARYYWSETFVFWTTLLQACISTTHILTQAEEFAMFIKAWYRVLDITKIEVSKTLKQYIIISQVTLGLFLLGMVIMFFLPTVFDNLQGTAIMIVIALREPVSKQQADLPSLKKSYKLAFVGLLVYLIAIVFSWMYIMQFMVFCRCFRKGLKCINERIAMILNVDDVQRVGPNALRLTYEYIHKDYLGIATTGIKIGKIFSWTMCNYYLWAILVLVVELGEIFKLAKLNYRAIKQQEAEATSQFETALSLANKETQEKALPLPVQHIISELLHLTVTTICIFYVSYEGSGAHMEGKMSYELARYKGLVDCNSQLERNFIRSIWIIVSDKCPVHVAPGKFFGITHSTIMTVFATALMYFIFWVQSQKQLGAD